ncbi:Sporulation kinase A [compost metagenome]
MLLLIISVFLDRRYYWLQGLQFLILGAFHYTTELNWCILLYYILFINLIQNKMRFRETLPLGMLIILEYTIIRLTYMAITTSSLLVSLFDFLTLTVIVLLFHVIVRIETEKNKLRKQNDYLTSHDPLTGLLNYEGYMQTVLRLVEDKKNFQLILLDINNFKLLNARDVTVANQLLIEVAKSLKAIFKDAYGLSRYAGDRFALLIPTREHLHELLNFDKFGLQITYSVTCYPQEASTFQGVINMAEDRIFQMRREHWAKGHEELMRSEKMKIVGELAAGMAHEIRNPLTSIKGFVQLSKSQEFNIQPWYEVIMSEITRVGELTAEFLQFSKPHVSNMKIESLSECVTRVYSLCESEAASRGHHFTLESSSDQIQICMDRDKITQVLINLIRNAFQAMIHPGQVEVSLKSEGHEAIIEVKDTGRGIPKEHLQSIFDPFFTTKEDGTGLGLSLCQKIIEDHQGSISVKSEINIGTRFTVRLPATT